MAKTETRPTRRDVTNERNRRIKENRDLTGNIDSTPSSADEDQRYVVVLWAVPRTERWIDLPTRGSEVRVRSASKAAPHRRARVGTKFVEWDTRSMELVLRVLATARGWELKSVDELNDNRSDLLRSKLVRVSKEIAPNQQQRSMHTLVADWYR